MRRTTKIRSSVGVKNTLSSLTYVRLAILRRYINRLKNRLMKNLDIIDVAGALVAILITIFAIIQKSDDVQTSNEVYNTPQVTTKKNVDVNHKSTKDFTYRVSA